MPRVSPGKSYPELLSWPVNEQLRYVRGFVDGEGGPRLYFHKAVNSPRRYANIRMVVISNTDLRLLSTIKRIFRSAHIESTIYLDQRAGTKRATKNSYVLVILRGQSLEFFGRLVGFTNPSKANKMRRIVDSYKRYAKTVKSSPPAVAVSRP